MRRIFLTTLFFAALAISLLNANASEQAEMHWSVCEKSSEIILSKLSLEIKDIEKRKLSYFDNWSDDQSGFVHYSQGLVLRLRQEESAYKSTVKIKFPNFPELSDEWSESVKCEMDLCAGGESYFCSLSEKSEGFSDKQKDFVKAFRAEPEWDSLEAHGPALNTVWNLKFRHPFSKMELEEIVLKNGEKIYELSTRSAVAQAYEAHARISSWLKSRRLKLCDRQESKTIQVLNSYKSL